MTTNLENIREPNHLFDWSSLDVMAP